VFLTCSWVTADLAAGIFHVYAGNMLRADDGSVFVGFKQMVPITSVRGAELPPRSLLCAKHCLSSTSTISNLKLTQELAQARQQLVPLPIPAHKDTAMSLARSSHEKRNSVQEKK
jgi:hypothetical protein